MLWPGRYCWPHHGMPFNSKNEGLKMRWMTVAMTMGLADIARGPPRRKLPFKSANEGSGCVLMTRRGTSGKPYRLGGAHSLPGRLEGRRSLRGTARTRPEPGGRRTARRGGRRILRPERYCSPRRGMPAIVAGKCLADIARHVIGCHVTQETMIQTACR